ncbi:MAG: hypothetical protein GY780_06825 [bacterium]|nr:hypothetical protein [bacterium]
MGNSIRKLSHFLWMTLLLALLFGCAGRVQNIEQSESFNLDPMLQEPWAIGGLVINPSLIPDKVARKELQELSSGWLAFPEAYSPLVYGGFVRHNPQMELWTFSTVSNLIPAAELKKMLSDFSSSQPLLPETLAKISQSIPKIKYLVLTRLNETGIENKTTSFDQYAENSPYQDGDPKNPTMTRSMSVRRSVELTMIVFDLNSGQQVWSCSRENWKDEVFNFNQDVGNVDIVTEGEEGAPKTSGIRIEGTPVRGPELKKVLAEGCVGLVQELIKEEK